VARAQIGPDKREKTGHWLDSYVAYAEISEQTEWPVFCRFPMIIGTVAWATLFWDSIRRPRRSQCRSGLDQALAQILIQTFETLRALISGPAACVSKLTLSETCTSSLAPLRANFHSLVRRVGDGFLRLASRLTVVKVAERALVGFPLI
jgi:hypothetical protein